MKKIRDTVGATDHDRVVRRGLSHIFACRPTS